jgi:hypothetical protein
MANTFKIEPIDFGDSGVWGPKELAQNRPSLGAISCLLYDDGGTLKINKGQIGFDDGTNKGISVIDTITTISLASVSAGNWAKIEMAISLGAPVFTATDIAGATTAATIPTGFTGAWDYSKQGYYISATKRCIGLIWYTGGSVLSGVVNCIPMGQGYLGTSAGANVFLNIKGVDFKTLDILTALSAAGISFKDSTGTQQALVSSVGVSAAVIQALGAAGIILKDDAGNGYFYLADGGKIRIGGTVAPTYDLDVTGVMRATLGKWPTLKVNTTHFAPYNENAIFDILAPYVPNTNDERTLAGSMATVATTYTIAHMIRASATQITVNVQVPAPAGTDPATLTWTDGGAGAAIQGCIFDVI